MAEEQVNDMEINNGIRRTMTQMMIDCNSATYRSTKGNVRVSGTLKHLGPPKPQDSIPAELKKLEDRIKMLKGTKRVIIEFDGFEKDDKTGEYSPKKGGKHLSDSEKTKQKIEAIKEKKQMVEDKKHADSLGLSLKEFYDKRKAGLISPKGGSTSRGPVEGEIDISHIFSSIRLECPHNTQIQFCPCCASKEFKVYAVLNEGFHIKEGESSHIEETYSPPQMSFSTPSTPETPSSVPETQTPHPSAVLNQETPSSEPDEEKEIETPKPASNEYNPLTDDGSDDNDDNSSKSKILALLQQQKESRFSKKKTKDDSMDLDFDF